MPSLKMYCRVRELTLTLTPNPNPMEDAGVSIASVNLAAFVSESAAEGAFGQGDMRTQYKHPDMPSTPRASRPPSLN